MTTGVRSRRWRRSSLSRSFKPNPMRNTRCAGSQSRHPDFIVRIRALASDRGYRAHGSRVRLASDTELDSDAFMRAAVSTLIPAVRVRCNHRSRSAALSGRSLVGCPNEPARRLSDSESFNSLGPDAQNSLIEAERFWLVAQDDDDGREFVLNLYAALQGVLRGFLGGAAPLGLADDEYKKRAGERARDAGLVSPSARTGLGQLKTRPRSGPRQGPLRRGVCARHASDQQRGPSGTSCQQPTETSWPTPENSRDDEGTGTSPCP